MGKRGVKRRTGEGQAHAMEDWGGEELIKVDLKMNPQKLKTQED